MANPSINPAGKTWNYLGRFYGVNPRWLAFFNGKPDASLASPVQGKVRVPTARDLVELRPEYERHFSQRAEPGLLVGLEPPTLTPLTSAVPHAPISARTGNQAIVNAVRMRRFSHTGDNYVRTNDLRSPNPRIWANARWPAEPDRNVHVGSDQWWKCNVLVGDSVYAAGYDWPISGSHAYPQPANIPPWAAGGVLDGTKYATAVWVSNQFDANNGHRFVDSGKYQPPTWEDLKDAQPGDVVALHSHGDGPGHSAILTAPPRKVTFVKDGVEVVRTMLRVVDIYGEQWYDAGDSGGLPGVRGHTVGAILRPNRRLPGGPAASVGGDPNRPSWYLDEKEDGTIRETLNDDPVVDGTFRMRHLFARNQGLLEAPPAAFSPQEAEWLKGMRVLTVDLATLPDTEPASARKPFAEALTTPLVSRAKEHIAALAEAAAAVPANAPDELAANDVAQRSRAVQGIIEAVSVVDADAAKTLEVSHLMARNEALLRYRPEGSSPGETDWLAGMRTLVADFAALREPEAKHFLRTFGARLTTPLSDAAKEHLTAIAAGTAPETHARAVEEIIALVAQLDAGAATELSMGHLVAQNATLLNQRPAAGAPEEAEWLGRIQALAGELRAVSDTGYARKSFLKQLAAPVKELAREHIAALAAVTAGRVVAEVEAPGDESPVATDVARHADAVKSLIAAVGELDSSATRVLEVELEKALSPPAVAPSDVSEPVSTIPVSEVPVVLEPDTTTTEAVVTPD